MLHAVKKGVPLIVLPMPLAGGTSPITLAGTPVMGNAEDLSALVLSQAIRPGAAFIHGSISTVMDMRTASVSLAAPEFALLLSAKAQVARFLGLPSYSGIGSVDSPRVDVQAGLEAMMCYLTGVLSGLNLTVSARGTAVARAYSYEMLLIDHAVFETCDRFQRGLRIDEDKLALDVISEVGPGGHFLRHPHTLKYLGSGEHHYPSLYSRSTDETLPAMLQRAHEEVQQILREHRVGVPKAVREEARRYVEEREGELQGQGG